MRTTGIPYQMQGDQLVTQALKWPDRCACCGRPHPGSWVPLKHQARLGFAAGGTRATLYPLEWAVPYCDACEKHSREARYEAPVLIAMFAIWLGLGYYLFLLGLENDTTAIAVYAAFLALSFFGSYALIRWLKASHDRRARRMMTPDCGDIKRAVNVQSDSSSILFKFHNDDVANEFASLNGAT